LDMSTSPWRRATTTPSTVSNRTSASGAITRPAFGA
jgi:hypothetical protein